MVTIDTADEDKKMKKEHPVKCANCGKIVFWSLWEKTTICHKCKKEIDKIYQK